MQRDGAQFELGAKLKRIESQNGQPPVKVVLETDTGERSFDFDALLMATGRKPAVSRLGLDEAGIKYDERMGIHIDDSLRTSNPDVFAVGDVASKYQFTHMADFMARMVIRNALFFGRDKFSSFLIPWATYTDPEVAHVGLYEKDLQDRDMAYSTFHGNLPMSSPLSMARLGLSPRKGSIKFGRDIGSHAGGVGESRWLRRMGLSKLASDPPVSTEAIDKCDV